MPHIKEDSIQRIREAADIADIVGQFVDLKKNKGCCPFHDEKSPSFTVTPNKGIYKCYGCGAGGDSVSFIMQHERMDFIQAVEWIASRYNIKVEYDSKEINEVEIQEGKQMQTVLNTAAKKYQELLWKMKANDVVPVELLATRQLSIDTILEFQIGYAPNEWKFLTSPIIQSNLFKAATDLGICVSRNSNTYDQFRHRIMFPIQDMRGNIVGFGGRKLQPVTQEEKDADKDNPKYINSKDSKMYNKERVLYGLYQAATSIRKMGYAILTEGYYDVLSMHDKGATNTVATCGTALTSAHARLLKKYTNHVVIFYDMDKAGSKATLKAVDELVKLDMKVEVFSNETFEGQDPDSFARLFSGILPEWTFGNVSIPDPFEYEDEVLRATPNGLLQEIKNSVSDGIFFKVRTLMEETADSDDHEKTVAFNDVCGVIALIKEEYKRDRYIDQLAKEFKIKPTTFNNKVKELIGEEKKRLEKMLTIKDTDTKVPHYVNKEETMQSGFYADENPGLVGMWFWENGGFDLRTNCTLTPIMHIYSKDKLENRRIIELYNGKPDGRIAIEIENKAFQSLEAFEAALWNEGDYITYNLNKFHLQKIRNKFSSRFPKCWELKFLGWQPEGFFAYANMIYHGQNKELVPYNNYGIIQYKGVNYYSPSGSNIQKNTRLKDDEFKNEKLISYIEPPITFARWAELMHAVYGDAGKAGILYVFVGLFRDVIFKHNNSCPFLYGYGEAGSGKTTWADSISALFFKGIKAFNLNQGTDAAFFSRLGRYYNCVITLNEFDEYAIRDHWFRALKGAFDGEGRERGTIKKNKTETQEIESALLLIGQYLSTRDDASVLSRSIPEEFKKIAYTNESTALFDELKQYEQHGLTGLIIEPLQYRDKFEDQFPEMYNSCMRRIKDELKLRQWKVKHDRVIQSYSVMLAVYQIMSQYIQLPFSAEEYFEYTIKRTVKLANTIGDNNALSEFWKMMQMFYDNNLIHEGWDFRIETSHSVKIKSETHKEDFEKQFPKPTKILYLRLLNVHSQYKARMRTENGENGLSEANVINYFKSDVAYIGQKESMHFSKKGGPRMVSSCYVFNLELMKINLERFIDAIDGPEKTVTDEKAKDLPF